MNRLPRHAFLTLAGYKLAGFQSLQRRGQLPHFGLMEQSALADVEQDRRGYLAVDAALLILADLAVARGGLDRTEATTGLSDGALYYMIGAAKSGAQTYLVIERRADTGTAPPLVYWLTAEEVPTALAEFMVSGKPAHSLCLISAVEPLRALFERAQAAGIDILPTPPEA